ncbi:MAG: M20 family metallopeptidase [Erysipelotrichaceae bacterium]|nr:M20 family metallopeptidase [Erysipelotrichaceae bacterium]
MIKVKELVNKYHDETIAVRRYLHAHPELSEQEYETCKYLQSKLSEAGIPFEVTPSNRSVVATIKGKYPGKTIVLRADIDALPIQENTGLPFSSEVDGLMHACGHDTHAAIGLACALAINDVKDELHGNFKVLFQEAEETMFGALHALESGLLDDCDNSIMLHVVTDRDTGVFVCNYGVRCAKVGSCVIDVEGRAGHSSRPEQAVNAALVGAKIVDAIADITAFEIPRSEFVIFTPTLINSDSKENIIPGSCHILANARYFDDKWDEFLDRRIHEVAESIAKAYGATAKVTFTPEGTPMVNDDEMTTHALEIIERKWGKEKLVRTPAALFGDDFAFIQKKFPGVVVNLGAAKNGEYTIGHNEKMMVDEDYMDIGAEFIETYVLEYLNVECE